MARYQAMEEDILPRAFADLFAEAKTFVLEHNDLDAALARLRLVEPRSQSDWWQWTDFTAALLFHKGNHAECVRILVSYDTRYPGDQGVASVIQKLGDLNRS